MVPLFITDWSFSNYTIFASKQHAIFIRKLTFLLLKSICLKKKFTEKNEFCNRNKNRCIFCIYHSHIKSISQTCVYMGVLLIDVLPHMYILNIIYSLSC